MQSFADGFRFFFRGLGFVRQHRLWRFAILPASLSLLLGVLLVVGTYYVLSESLLRSFDAGISRVAQALSLPYAGLPGWLRSLASILLLLATFLAQLILYRAFASILVLPFLGPLLSEVERIVLGQPVEVSLASDIKNALRGLLVGIRLGLLSLLALLLGLFLGPLQIVPNAVVQSYALGRGGFDLVFEKVTADANRRRQLVRENRAAILGMGLAFFLVLFVPILGVVMAPVAGAAGAALFFYRNRSPK